MPAETERTFRTGPFRTGPVLLLSACHFVHDAYTAFLAPLLPLLIDKLSMSLTQAGFLSTVMQIPALLNPLIGRLADRIRVRWFVVTAPVVTAVCMSLIGLAPSYGVLLLLLFTAGISTSIFHVPAPAMVTRMAGSRTGKGMSFFMTGGELARTVGPMAAVGAVSLWGLEEMYPVMSVGICASAWLWLQLRVVSVTTIVHTRKTALQRGVWQSTGHVLGPLAGILFARGFMHASVVTFLPTFIRQETGDLWLAGISLALVETTGVIGVLTSGTLSDRMGRRRVLMAALLIAPIALLLFVLAAPIWLRLAALLIAGFSLLATTPVMLALVQESAGDKPSAANGWFMMLSFIARSAVVVIVGFFGDLLGLRVTFLLSAVLGLFALPFIRMLPASGRHV
jgi:FSR family fosmidomycin resistance protein-like MFS transporter